MTKTLTAPRNPATEIALSAKLASEREFSSGSFFSKVIVEFIYSIFSNKKEDAERVLLIETNLFRGRLADLRNRPVPIRRSRIQQVHLFLRYSRFVLVIGTNDALYQMMPHHVAFIEVRER